MPESRIRPRVEDDEEDYRVQVARYPRLSGEAEARLLATRGSARDNANRTLIEHNLYLVFEAAVARKERGVPFGDLFQEGTVGLISAVEHHRAGESGFHSSLVQAISAVMDDVLAQTTPDATIGRPHIADALVAKGHVRARGEAFATILHWRAGYYEPHYAPEPREGVELVRAAGGVSVIAHPAVSYDRILPEDYLRQLVDAGLFGLEVHHRDNSRTGAKRLLELAGKYDLAVTGSSDYHGTGKLNRLGENTTAPEVVERLVAAATGWAPVDAER